MNPDFSQLPPEERELHLTALLLRELSPAEADVVRLALAADTELAREHDRLQETIALVRETAAMECKTSTEGTPLRLDDQRREKLLAAFKTPAPTAAPRSIASCRPRNLWYVPLSLAALLVGLLALVAALPLFVKSRASSPQGTLLRNPEPVGSFSSLFERSSEKSVPRSARTEIESFNKRETELVLTDNFSVSDLGAEGFKAKPTAPVAKLPAVALAMPALADTDGEARALKETLSEFNASVWKEKAGTESLARSDVRPEPTGAGEVVSRTTRGFFVDSPNAAPTPTPANIGALWANNDLLKPAGPAAGNPASTAPPNSPAVHGVDDVYSVDAVGYVNNNLISGYNLISTPLGDAPSTPPPASSLSVEAAQSIIEARRLQLPQSATPATAVLREKSSTLGQLAQQQGISDKRMLGEVDSAWSSTLNRPAAAANMSPGGDAGRGGGVGGVGGISSGRGSLAARGGLVVVGGGSFGGVNIVPGGTAETAGRNAGDLAAVEQKNDGLADLTPAPLTVRARIAGVNESSPDTFSYQYESKLKQVEDRFGRADDFVLTPEVLDAVKQKIQNAPSSGGLAGMSAAKDSLSASRPSLATTPSASGRISSAINRSPSVPVQMTVSQSSSFIRINRPSRVIPAFATRISTGAAAAASAAAIRPSTAAGSARLATTTAVRSPSWPARSASTASRVPDSTTWAPCSWRVRAISAPMPPVAPVTSAVLPDRSNMRAFLRST